MRILLDTNIIIHREASRVINPDIGKLFQWFDRLGAKKIVHPLSIKEISGYQDKSVVDTMKVKIGNYFLLKTESNDTDKILEMRSKDKTDNDIIDTSMVKELSNGRVDLIVTEDRGIHKKAVILGVGEKVFTIDSYIDKVTAENPELTDYKVLSVKKEYFGNVDINDSFFDSFKEDYCEFDNWFRKKSDNISYICYADENIGAFLYLKVEDIGEPYSDIVPQFKPKKRLKIGTFKVTSTGYKLGERFLKIIFDNALNFNVDEIYVTIFEKRDEQVRLIKLLEDWGFRHWGHKNTDNGVELVYVRRFDPVLDENKPKDSYPFISRNKDIYIVPIYPDYHTNLLPDSVLNTEDVGKYTENEPHRNAIQKVYISRSFEMPKPNDLILFYRTGGLYKSVITTVGIVENVYKNISSEEKFIELCRKRSVFGDEELSKFWNWRKWARPFVVNFLYVYSLPKKLNLSKLIELGIIASVNDAPRGFQLISKENFNTIMKESFADESCIVD